MQTYLELKLSWGLFKKAPESLSEPERGRLRQVALKQTAIERRILKSPEAAGVVVPGAIVAARLAEIRGRYAETDGYRHDLDRLGLDESALADAVERDLRVEAVLDRIGAAATVDEVDAEIFYRLHPDAFERPDARRLRHILITFGSAREKAAVRRQLASLRGGLRSAEEFAAAALRHSQCPTAMQGGELGLVKRGQLYAELEPGAFALAESEVSAVLESPVGLHLLRCDRVFAGGKMDFELVKPRIVEKLSEQRRHRRQKEWIAGLPA